MNFVMTAQDADLRQDRITLSGNRFRHIDMVLIDDFQYFAGRTALQEQLLESLLPALEQALRESAEGQFDQGRVVERVRHARRPTA